MFELDITAYASEIAILLTIHRTIYVQNGKLSALDMSQSLYAELEIPSVVVEKEEVGLFDFSSLINFMSSSTLTRVKVHLDKELISTRSPIEVDRPIPMLYDPSWIETMAEPVTAIKKTLKNKLTSSSGEKIAVAKYKNVDLIEFVDALKIVGSPKIVLKLTTGKRLLIDDEGSGLHAKYPRMKSKVITSVTIGTPVQELMLRSLSLKAEKASLYISSELVLVKTPTFRFSGVAFSDKQYTEG